MSRQLFNIKNQVDEIIIQTDSGPSDTFNPSISIGGGKRVSWDLGEGDSSIANNSISYTYPDTNVKTVKLKSNFYNLEITQLLFQTDNIIGTLDLSKLIKLGGNIRLNSNPLLTGITNPTSSQTFIRYWAYSCNLTGTLDVSGLSGLGGDFFVYTNPNLTGITNPISSVNFNNYIAHSCNLTGTLDVSGLSGLGGNFNTSVNPNLTGITNPTNDRTFTFYWAYSCNLTGTLDLSGLSGLGGNFRAHSNSNLTGITNPISSQVFTLYRADNCNLTGTLDVSGLSGLGGVLNLDINPNLTGIANPTSSQPITTYIVSNCNLTGTLDLSSLSGFGSVNTTATNFRCYNNPNLTNIIFPITTNTFRNVSIASFSAAFALYTCDLNYIDFTPLVNATLDSTTTNGVSILIQNNNMIVDDVNHILVDLLANAAANSAGWSNVILNISGTNAAPDSSSGGYDGLAAITDLETIYGWTITTS